MGIEEGCQYDGDGGQAREGDGAQLTSEDHAGAAVGRRLALLARKPVRLIVLDDERLDRASVDVESLDRRSDGREAGVEASVLGRARLVERRQGGRVGLGEEDEVDDWMRRRRKGRRGERISAEMVGRGRGEDERRGEMEGRNGHADSQSPTSALTN